MESYGTPDAHYTEIRLERLHKVPAGRTLGKIKQHLADIYREFLRRGDLILMVDTEALSYEEPRVLVAPYSRMNLSRQGPGGFR
jgi:hypothetical protein